MPKKYKVDITASAEADIAARWDYIAQDNPASATAFVLRPEEQIAALEVFPERCPLAPESEYLGLPYRHQIFGQYRTIFKMAGARVIIMRVVHGARLLDTALLEDLGNGKLQLPGSRKTFASHDTGSTRKRIELDDSSTHGKIGTKNWAGFPDCPSIR